MDAFQLTVQQCEPTISIQKSVLLTVDEELDFQQEADNRENRCAVAVYGDTQSSTVLGHLLREISLRVLHVFGARWYNQG